MKIFQSLPYMYAPNTGAKFTSWQQNSFSFFCGRYLKYCSRVLQKKFKENLRYIIF